MSTYYKLLIELSLVCVVSMTTGIQIQEMYGGSNLCGTVTSLDNRRMMQSVKVHSKPHCLRHCAFDIVCVDAVLLNNTGSDFLDCLLLAFEMDATVQWTYADGCFIIEVRPCHNGGQFIDGLCRCPSNYKGIYCERPNEARCSQDYQLIHHGHATDSATYSYPMNGLTALSSLRTADFKVSADSLLANHVSVGGITIESTLTFWGAQVLEGLTLDISAGEVSFASPPLEEAFLVKANGDLEVLQYSLDGGQTNRYNAYGNNKVYSRPSDGFVAMDTSTGSTYDVIQAVNNGYESIAQQRTVMYDNSNDALVMKCGKLSWAQSNPMRFIIPVYLYNAAFDANTGRFQVYREVMSGTNSYPVRWSPTTWIFDPCWYSASSDARQSNATNSTVHLQRALQEGRRVRVVYQGVSSKVKVAYLTQNGNVIFEISPYVSPKYDFTMDSNSKMVRTLVSTSGRVKSCWNVMRQSASTYHEDYVIGSGEMEWFVDSRTWELVYTTDMAGTWLSGDFSVLKDAATEGADVNLFIVRDDVERQISMLADWIHVGQATITAEVRSVSDVNIVNDEIQWPDSSKCILMHYLIGTHSGVKAFRYTYEATPIKETQDLTSTSGKVYWFVSR